MLLIVCNLILPGLGTLFMRKPIQGTLQLLVLTFALVLLASVFLAFFGILFWFVDMVWALVVGILWYRKQNITTRETAIDQK